MRTAVLLLALAGGVLSSAQAFAQVAANPRDESYCDDQYRLGAAARLNCVLNSRQSGDIRGSVFDPPYYYPPRQYPTRGNY